MIAIILLSWLIEQEEKLIRLENEVKRQRADQEGQEARQGSDRRIDASMQSLSQLWSDAQQLQAWLAGTPQNIQEAIAGCVRQLKNEVSDRASSLHTQRLVMSRTSNSDAVAVYGMHQNMGDRSKSGAIARVRRSCRRMESEISSFLESHATLEQKGMLKALLRSINQLVINFERT